MLKNKPLLLILTLLMIPFSASAQNNSTSLLKEKTEKRLQEIVSHSSGVAGLTAVDLTTGERFAVNAQTIFPQASAIKIPILLEVYKQAHQGKFKLTDTRYINPKETVGGTGVLKDLIDNTSLSIRNLCILMIVFSDNTATNLLLDLVGMPSINATLQSLDLQHTKVQRRMLHTAASGKGEENLSTPAEAARIMEILYKGAFINKAISEEILSILKKNPRENSYISATLPEDVQMAFKPGILNGVSTEWAIVYLKERPYILTLMENYKQEKETSHVMEKVSEALYSYFWRIGNATPYGTYVDPVLIQGK